MKYLLNILLLLCSFVAQAKEPSDHTFAFVRYRSYGKEVLSAYKVTYSKQTVEPYLTADWVSSDSQNFSPVALAWPKGADEPVVLTLPNDKVLKKILRNGASSELMDRNFDQLTVLSEGPDGKVYLVNAENQVIEVEFEATGSYKTKIIYHTSKHSAGQVMQVQTLTEKSFLLLTDKRVLLIENAGAGFTAVADAYLGMLSVTTNGITFNDYKVIEMVGDANFAWVLTRFEGAGSFRQVALLIDLNQRKIQTQYVFGEDVALGALKLLDMRSDTIELVYKKEGALYSLSPTSLKEQLEAKDVFSLEYLSSKDPNIYRWGKLEHDVPRKVAMSTRRALNEKYGSNPKTKLTDPETAFQYKMLLNNELAASLKKQMTLGEFVWIVNHTEGLLIHLYVVSDSGLPALGLRRQYNSLVVLPGHENDLLDHEGMQTLISKISVLMELGRKEKLANKCQGYFVKP